MVDMAERGFDPIAGLLAALISVLIGGLAAFLLSGCSEKFGDRMRPWLFPLAGVLIMCIALQFLRIGVIVVNCEASFWATQASHWQM